LVAECALETIELKIVEHALQPRVLLIVSNRPKVEIDRQLGHWGRIRRVAKQPFVLGSLPRDRTTPRVQRISPAVEFVVE
jgi:hypothetical protein